MIESIHWNRDNFVETRTIKDFELIVGDKQFNVETEDYED